MHSCRATKGGYEFLAAIYRCEVGSEFENPQYNRLYCSQENWIPNTYYPTCTSTGESEGKRFQFQILFRIFISISRHARTPYVPYAEQCTTNYYYH